MKFELVFDIRPSDKSAINHFKEMKRLGFSDYNGKTLDKVLRHEVDEEFVIEHEEWFNGDTKAYFNINSEDTKAEQYEDWGSVGNVATSKSFSLEDALAVATLKAY